MSTARGKVRGQAALFLELPPSPPARPAAVAAPAPPAERCANCNGPIVPVLYGRPTKASERRAQHGEVIIGGCVITPTSPLRACWRCKKAHGPTFGSRFGDLRVSDLGKALPATMGGEVDADPT